MHVYTGVHISVWHLVMVSTCTHSYGYICTRVHSFVYTGPPDLGTDLGPLDLSLVCL